RRTDERLLIDRNAIARFDRRFLIVERGEVRIVDHTRVAVRVEQMENRLHAAEEVQIVDDVVEAGAQRERRRSRDLARRYRRIERRRAARAGKEETAAAAASGRSTLEQPFDAELQTVR